MISETGCSPLNFQRGRVWREGTQFTNIYPLPHDNLFAEEKHTKAPHCNAGQLAMPAKQTDVWSPRVPLKKEKEMARVYQTGQRPAQCQLHSNLSWQRGRSCTKGGGYSPLQFADEGTAFSSPDTDVSQGDPGTTRCLSSSRGDRGPGH